MTARLVLVATAALGAGIGAVALTQPPALPPAGPPPYIAALPDPKLTPGAVLDVGKEQVCVRGYAGQVRNVPESVKRAVYAEYGIRTHAAGDYEVDHLISLELGGSNEIENLWPQSYRNLPWTAHVKDALEDELHSEVCAGTLPLKQAQEEIRTDWVACYQRHFHSAAPLGPHKRRVKVTE